MEISDETAGGQRAVQYSVRAAPPSRASRMSHGFIENKGSAMNRPDRFALIFPFFFDDHAGCSPSGHAPTAPPLCERRGGARDPTLGGGPLPAAARLTAARLWPDRRGAASAFAPL